MNDTVSDQNIQIPPNTISDRTLLNSRESQLTEKSLDMEKDETLIQYFLQSTNICLFEFLGDWSGNNKDGLGEWGSQLMPQDFIENQNFMKSKKNISCIQANRVNFSLANKNRKNYYNNVSLSNLNSMKANISDLNNEIFCNLENQKIKCFFEQSNIEYQVNSSKLKVYEQKNLILEYQRHCYNNGNIVFQNKQSDLQGNYQLPFVFDRKQSILYEGKSALCKILIGQQPIEIMLCIWLEREIQLKNLLFQKSVSNMKNSQKKKIMMLRSSNKKSQFNSIKEETEDIVLTEEEQRLQTLTNDEEIKQQKIDLQQQLALNQEYQQDQLKQQTQNEKQLSSEIEKLYSGQKQIQKKQNEKQLQKNLKENQLQFEIENNYSENQIQQQQFEKNQQQKQKSNEFEKNQQENLLQEQTQLNEFEKNQQDNQSQFENNQYDKQQIIGIQKNKSIEIQILNDYNGNNQLNKIEKSLNQESLGGQIKVSQQQFEIENEEQNNIKKNLVKKQKNISIQQQEEKQKIRKMKKCQQSIVESGYTLLCKKCGKDDEWETTCLVCHRKKLSGYNKKMAMTCEFHKNNVPDQMDNCCICRAGLTNNNRYGFGYTCLSKCSKQAKCNAQDYVYED